ncbi:beta-ketoacyl synthase N-terminal-like domain-containing protein [Burkholderia metallica]
MNSRDLPDDEHTSSIAIIGMAGRFPGAPDVDAFWRNLRDGVESIRFYSDEELREAGVDDEYIDSPHYVKAAAVLDDADRFDARFFNLSPNEAQYIDPQHRIFMECAVEALDNASCDPERFDGAIGVYAGAALSYYELEVAFSNYEQLATSDALQTLFATGIANDYLVTRVSYKLNLRGPGLTVQTACSTSLVAVHLACQNLLSGECDIALAGGVSIQSSYRKAGYFYTEGGMVSGDGHCRPFDANATGTIFGDGVGIVVLKRLDRAIADGDNIRAVIRGTAINNDGSEKLGFTAPGVRGQSAVITEALAAAGIAPDTVDYVEAHGTGTILGDPIEIAALTQVYTALSSGTPECRVGSVKGNVGHLNHASGITGLIKVVMSLENQQLPPSLNYQTPNPNIDFAASPFRVNTALTDWSRGAVPRRAGVNAFGIGGTNAHVIVEEAPLPAVRDGRRRKWWLLPVSAKSPDARTAMQGKHAAFLREHDDLDVRDVAWTLALGRTLHRYAGFAVVKDIEEAASAMETGDRHRLVIGERQTRERKVAFLFPGQGTQHVRMGLGLYDEEPAFRAALDECLEKIERVGGIALRAVLFPDEAGVAAAAEALQNTVLAQPAIFAVSYALAALWRAWGVEPVAMLGHSIGELVAACVAGVFTLDDALRVVCERGRLMQAMAPGRMVIVPAGPEAIAPLLGPDVAIAAINAQDTCVISGPDAAVDAAEGRLRGEGLFCTDLRTSHAFHSSMMAPAIPDFVALLDTITLHAPTIPFASNVTGRLITAEEAISPDYWGRQLGGTVHFARGFETLVRDAGIDLLLEVGPGHSLASLGQRNLPNGSSVTIVSSMPRPDGREEEGAALLKAVAQLILAGVPFDPRRLFDDMAPRNVVMPSTHFVRERYWAAIRDESAGASLRPKKAGMTAKVLDSLYGQVWTRALPVEAPTDEVLAERPQCLVFANGDPLCTRLVETLRGRGLHVAVVEPGEAYARTGESNFTASPGVPEHFVQLLADLQTEGRAPHRIVYAWSLPGVGDALDGIDGMLDHGFFGLLHTLQALALHGKDTQTDLLVIGADALEVLGTEVPRPASALAFGPALVASLELVGVNSRFIDLTAENLAAGRLDAVIDLLLRECVARTQANVVAYRGGNRWLPSYESIDVASAPASSVPIRHKGVYMITGGLGDLGLAFAHWLAKDYQAKLILVGRSGVPDREHWPALLAEQQGDSRLAGVVSRLLDIEAVGGEILVGKADSADHAAMLDLVTRARARFGDVHGILHLAGLAGTGPMILRNRQELMPILAPKVHGIDVIETLFADAPLDFVALFSSIAAITGGLGQAAYTSANAYMDAYSRQRAHGCAQRVIAINWDAWGEIGMAVTTPLPDRLAAIWEKELASFGIGTADGIEIFRRLLATGRNGVLVSRRVSYADDSVPAGMVRVVPPTKQISESALPTETTGNRYPRPSIGSDYLAPRNELETILVEFWGEALSVDGIGVLDDFFELGGHSLLALQMIPRLRARFGIDINPRDLFSAEGTATIAELAQVIEIKLLDELKVSEGGEAADPVEMTPVGAQNRDGMLVPNWAPAQESPSGTDGTIVTSPLSRE